MNEPRYESRSDVRAWLICVFETEARGVDQARTITALQMTDGCPLIGARGDEGKAVASRQLRRAIAELVEIDGLPIVGDSRRGYYLAATPDDLRRGYRELRRRSLRMLHRAKRLLDKGRDRLGGQLPLDLKYQGKAADLAMSALEEDDDE